MTDIVGGSPVAPGSYRTTAEAVRAILGVASEVDVLPFMATANSIITKVETCAGGNLTDADLELLERWVSAHFYSVINPGLTSKSIAGASTSFHRGQLGQGMESTVYGQQALLMDMSGCLEKVTGQTMTMTWLGIDS